MREVLLAPAASFRLGTMTEKFKERDGAAPIVQPHYIFDSLNNSEKLTIRIVYWKKWRRFVKNGRLSKNQELFFKIYFFEIHTRYYETVVKGGSYVTAARLVKNFFFSKVNENLRTVLTALTPYNLTSFVHGIRSQIELNALLHKFLKDPAYHKAHILLNEDRKLVKELPTVINVNTLVEGLRDSGLPYAEIYGSLSLLLHPNPSAIKFYGQAEGLPTSDGKGLFQPKVKFYFDKTISHNESSSDWFSDHVWVFLTFVEHFLILIDKLTTDFYLNEDEEKQHNQFIMAEFIAAHQKEILKAANEAHRSGQDPQDAISKAFESILSASGKGTRE